MATPLTRSEYCARQIRLFSERCFCPGLMILRFNINPALTSCRRGCFVNTSVIAETAKNLVNTFSFNLSDISSQTLYVRQLPAFYSWTGQHSWGSAMSNWANWVTGWVGGYLVMFVASNDYIQIWSWNFACICMEQSCIWGLIRWLRNVLLYFADSSIVNCVAVLSISVGGNWVSLYLWRTRTVRTSVRIAVLLSR